MYLFIYFKDSTHSFDSEKDNQREREHTQGEWERKKQAHSRAGSLMRGSIPECRDHALSRRQTLNRCATQAPPDMIIFIDYIVGRYMVPFLKSSVNAPDSLM